MLATLFLHISIPTAPMPIIIGGDTIDQGLYPSFVSLKNYYSNSHYCGATIIHAKYAITAAHCLSGTPTNNYVTQDHSVLDQISYPKFQVLDYIIHEEYNYLNNDIAVIKISETDIVPAPLPRSDTNTDTSAHSIGLGYIDNENTTPTELQYHDVTVISKNSCYITFVPGILCIFTDNDSTICSGDSGSGLYNDEGDVIGVTSFTFTTDDINCVTGLPDGASNVFYHMDFICKATNYEVNGCVIPPPLIPLPPLPPPSPPSPPPPPAPPIKYINALSDPVILAIIIVVPTCLAIGGCLIYFICKRDTTST